MQKNSNSTVLRKQTSWDNLWFYRKAVTLYQLTVVFTRRFLPAHGDRTVDQMIQAARSGKQNIVEGSADGVTSFELEIKLLNVARASIKELQEDYLDYLTSRHLAVWDERHFRFDKMVKFCRNHNDVVDFEPFFNEWDNEEMANVGYTLCRITDKMMTSYLKKLEAEFITEGGIKERMTAARLGYRNDMRSRLEEADRRIAALTAENAALANEIQRLRAIIAQLQR